MFLSIGMLKQKYFLADIFILSAEKQPIKLSWRKIEWLLKLSVKQAEENYRIMQNRYLNQLAILTDLLDANSVRLNAELQLTSARTRVIYTYYQLERACGRL